MIAEVTVEEGEQFAAGGGVYNLIYPRQTEGVFRAVFVKISRNGLALVDCTDPERGG